MGGLGKLTTLIALGMLAKNTKSDYTNLRQRQLDMKKANLIGGDNYYHRLGMCENAQKGIGHFVTSGALGLGKEGKDIFCKSTGICDNKQSLSDALKDSYKDMGNNIEGLYYGLTNPDKDCKEWLQDLDLEHNKWKNKK